jgi:hypothetical protein
MESAIHPTNSDAHFASENLEIPGSMLRIAPE